MANASHSHPNTEGSPNRRPFASGAAKVGKPFSDQMDAATAGRSDGPRPSNRIRVPMMSRKKYLDSSGLWGRCHYCQSGLKEEHVAWRKARQQ